MSRILVYDLETTPNLSYTWGKWEQNVIAFKQEWELLSFSWKWLGEKEVYAVGQNEFTEELLVLRLHQLFNEADVVIAHNNDSFDQKKSYAKFLEYNLSPPSETKSIDTLKVVKRYFKLNSNKLDDVGALLGVGRKVQTGGFSLWLGCMNNDPKAWAKMLKYNKQDVVLLEKIYLKLRPWIKNHPALNVIDDRPDTCPKCGHDKLEARGYAITKVAKRRRFQCKKCGGWSQSRSSIRTDVQFVN